MRGQAMERREFITLLGASAAAVWPLVARAQQPAVPVIGFLSSASHQTMAPEIAGFLQGLRETGYTEGRNIAIEYRWGAGQLERMPVLAAELVDRPVAVLFSHTELAIVAARAATTTIPIVFRTGADPVRAGYVASLNRPRGNLTGVTSLGADLGPKRLGLLHELVPTGTVIAVLVDQNFPDGVSQLMGLQEAARSVNRQTIVLNARTALRLRPLCSSMPVHLLLLVVIFLTPGTSKLSRWQPATLFPPFTTGASFQPQAV
jgi:putative tryptophan/tyrosine transport system substrate-binding protein